MISGYRMESLVETGVNFATYGARQMASGGTCLVRIISSGGSSEEFLSEAKLASSFFHPNVVDVYDAGSLDDGEVFVVSERPEGQTLREFLSETPVPKLLTTVEIIRQAAEALHALHLCGFTHAAINPENIILTDDPEGGLLVRLRNLDFGRWLERSITGNKFVVETALGSLRYYAPEQCSGEATNAQTDVYSLGVVFYEMLAGAPPFDAATATALIHKQKNQPAPDVRIDDFHLRMLVTHSLTESLQKPARLRQQTANAFARQLRHIEQLATHVSTPPPAGTVKAPRAEPPKFSPAPVFDLPVQAVRKYNADHLFDDAAVVRTETEVVNNPALGFEGTFDLKLEDVQPIAVEVEPAESVATPEVEIEQPAEIEIEAANVLEVAPVDVPISDRADIEGSEPLFDDTVIAPATREVPATPARRSRLKHLKKKLNAYAAHIRTGGPELRIVGSDEAPLTETPAVDAPILESLVVSTLADAPVIEHIFAEAVSSATPDVEAASLEPSAPAQPETVKLEKTEPEAAQNEIQEPAREIERPESVNTQEEPAKIVAAPVRRKRKKAELKKEEATVVEAALEREVPKEPVVETPVIETPVIETPVIGRGPQTAEFAAAVAATVKNAAVERKHKSKAMAATAGSARLHTKELVPAVHMHAEEDEDITLVRPRSRIKVEWAKPRTIYRPDAFSVRYRDEVKFVPTLLDKTVPTRVDLYSHQEEGMFSEQYASNSDRISIPYRAVAISCGVVALMGVFLFANDSISRYFQSVSPGDSVTAQATETAAPTKTNPAPKEGVPQAAPVSAVQVQATGIRDSAKVLAETSAPNTAEVPKTVPVKERASGDRNASRSTDAKRVDAKAPSAVKAAAPAKSSKPKPKTEAVDKPAVAKPEKVVPATRPRIVQEPRD